MSSRTIPPIDKGAERNKEKLVASERVTPLPMAMQIQPEIIMLRRLFGSREPDMCTGRSCLISSLLVYLNGCRVQVGDWVTVERASVAQLGRASDL